MPTLTAETTFTIGDAPVEEVSTQIRIVAIGAGVVGGKGRLEHPTLGIYDYPYAPDEWDNMDGDAIVAPVWQHKRTLDSGQNTLWPGKLKDVVCMERWTGEAAIKSDHLRMLMSFWMMPPDPAKDYIVWSPSYINANRYKVVMRSLRVGGDRVTLTHLHQQGLVEGPVELELGVVDYAD